MKNPTDPDNPQEIPLIYHNIVMSLSKKSTKTFSGDSRPPHFPQSSNHSAGLFNYLGVDYI